MKQEDAKQEFESTFGFEMPSIDSKVRRELRVAQTPSAGWRNDVLASGRGSPARCFINPCGVRHFKKQPL